MITSHPLARIFGGSRAKVLEVLLEVDDQLSVRHVARLTNLSVSTASEALQQLEQSFVVERSEVGGSHLYRLAGDNAVVPLLKRIASDALGIDRDFGRILFETVGALPAVAAVLYGSVARGEDALTSDVDILLVGVDLDIEQWIPTTNEAGERLSRYIGRPVQIVLSNWPTKADQKRPFWRDVKRDGRSLGGPRVDELLHA